MGLGIDTGAQKGICNVLFLKLGGRNTDILLFLKIFYA